MVAATILASIALAVAALALIGLAVPMTQRPITVIMLRDVGCDLGMM